MDFLLQFGYGMLEHSRHLLSSWGGGGVILSPRDMSPQQISALGQEVTSRNGFTMVDPQLYQLRADHHGMLQHEYWPNVTDTMDFLTGEGCNKTLWKIMELNETARSSLVIVPGLYCTRANDMWFRSQELFIKNAIALSGNKPLFATICLSAETMRFSEQIATIIQVAQSWPVNGVYLVAEHSGDSYFVEDPMWLSNLLSLCAGLKNQGKKVIVGYSNQQMLCTACTGVDAIASGTWMNVRMFSTSRFIEPDSSSISRRQTWYYCPQTLSEYKMQFLDMAMRREMLNYFSPSPNMNSAYADILFSGAQPSLTEFSEKLAFRHYLTCLFSQCKSIQMQSYDMVLEIVNGILNQTSLNLRNAHSIGVLGQNRDFSVGIDATKSAVNNLHHEMGFLLKRMWDSRF